MKTSELYRSAASIETAIAGIHERGQTLQLEMHKVACSVLQHLGTHKDVRMVMKLLNAMPEMSRTNGLREWFAAHGPIGFDGETAFFVPEKSTKLGDAMQKPFWKFKATEGAPYKPVNIDKEVETLIKRLRVDADKTGKDHSLTIKALMNAKAVQPNLTDKGASGSSDPLAL